MTFDFLARDPASHLVWYMQHRPFMFEEVLLEEARRSPEPHRLYRALVAWHWLELAGPPSFLSAASHLELRVLVASELENCRA